MEILCFFAGVAFYCLKSAYPVGLLFVFLFFRPRVVLIACFLAGIAWCAAHQWWVSTEGFPANAVINQANLHGVIVSIPALRAEKIQFQFLADELNGQAVHGLLLLSCYDHCPVLRAGETWRLVAKLKKPQNLGNPGGFDYVASLDARHIQWTGYTRRGTFLRMQATQASTGLIRLRQHLAEMLNRLDPDPKTIGILQALTLGVSHQIDADTWGLFRRTGTTHLMVISGAHIGLVAGLTYAFIKWLWCRSNRLLCWIPAPRVASLAGLLMAMVYALLAGFGVPAQRALIVCFFMLIRHFFNHRFSVWQAWRYALLAVLVYEPHAVVLPGFYLSFIAVAILIGMNQRSALMGFKKTLCLQLACLLGLMPLTLFCFSYGSMNGFFANLLAIPWVSFVIIPLGLLVTALGTWVPMTWVMLVVTAALKYLLIYLYWIDSLSQVNLTVGFTSFFSPLAMMLAMIILVFIPRVIFFPAVFILALAGGVPGYGRIKEGDVRIDFLDVGQGLAVVVQTAKHILVYDTGVQFYHGGDMGQLVLIPYLRLLGVRWLDQVIISHPDLDHRGGLASLAEKYPIRELLVDNPAVYKNAVSCHDYPAWDWDGVSFRFFPISEGFNGKNNRSCVLQIANRTGKVLLTGDIERAAEKYLVKTYAKQLRSTVMLIPHHGSKTSSTPLFIEAVSPKQAIVSYGFDNRYHFPHQQAMQVYQERQIPVYSTETCGLVRVLLFSRNRIPELQCSYGNK